MCPDLQISQERKYRFQIGIAGKTVQIESTFRRVYDQCRDYLVQSPCPDLYVVPGRRPADAFPPLREEAPGSEPLQDDLRESLAVCQSIADALIPSHILLMHGAVVAKDGCGYMFSAPSGVGKTTRVMRWLEAYPDATVVNGDKPLIQIPADGLPLAFGTPWCGKEGMQTNTAVPLRAVFCLERSAENRADLMDPAAAFRSLLPQTYRPADASAAREVLCLLRALTSRVSVYRFRSAPTREAARLAWETAKPV